MVGKLDVEMFINFVLLFDTIFLQTLHPINSQWFHLKTPLFTLLSCSTETFSLQHGKDLTDRYESKHIHSDPMKPISYGQRYCTVVFGLCIISFNKFV